MASLPGIHVGRWHRILRAHGCELVRSKGGHSTMQSPSGVRFTVTTDGRSGTKATVTWKEVRDAAQALGIDTKELLTK